MELFRYYVAQAPFFVDFMYLYVHCGKQLTQVRIAKLCVKYGIGAMIKRAIAPWNPSRMVHVRRRPARQNGLLSTQLRAMKSVWDSTW